LTFFTIYDEEGPVERTNESAAESGNVIKKNKISASKFKTDNKFRKVLYWICGVGKYLNKENETVDRLKTYRIDTSIDESTFWSTVCDINAVLAMALCGFLYAFFNKFN
jgi:hypothetical protein